MIARNLPGMRSGPPTLEVFERLPLIPMSGPIPIVFVISDDSVPDLLEAVSRGAGCRLEVFASGADLLARSRVVAPSCLVLDVSHPNRNDLEWVGRITTCRRAMPIIVVASSADVSVAVQAMKAGAFEFLTRPFSSEAISSVIQDALDHSRTALIDEAGTRALRDRYVRLSCREREVMAHVVAGLLNKQVGAALGISEITVKAHRGKVMRKMQAHSLADLVYMAVRLSQAPVSWPGGVAS